MAEKKSNLERAMFEAVVNGIVIGSLVAGVMIFSGNFSDIVVVRTTGAAMLLRFATYMIENARDVDAGNIGEYLGVGPSKRKKQFSLGKVI